MNWVGYYMCIGSCAFLFFCLLLVTVSIHAQQPPPVVKQYFVVATDGSGDFKKISLFLRDFVGNWFEKLPKPFLYNINYPAAAKTRRRALVSGHGRCGTPVDEASGEVWLRIYPDSFRRPALPDGLQGDAGFSHRKRG